MELRRDLLVMIGLLVVLNLILAFGSIGLLGRMSPAIEEILQENVYSMEAAEEMILVLVLASEEGVSEPDRERFEAALHRANNNITEGEERLLLADVERNKQAALAGDRGAVEHSVAQLRQLIVINREAMRTADDQARRLGIAGAWAAAFIALISFIVSIGVIRRVQRRVVSPLLELYRALNTVRKGDLHRRVHAGDAPMELKRVAQAVNELLDARVEQHDDEICKRDPITRVERQALVSLLQQISEPTVVVNEEGGILVANNAALERLAQSDGETLRNALEQGAANSGLKWTPLFEAPEESDRSAPAIVRLPMS